MFLNCFYELPLPKFPTVVTVKRSHVLNASDHVAG